MACRPAQISYAIFTQYQRQAHRTSRSQYSALFDRIKACWAFTKSLSKLYRSDRPTQTNSTHLNVLQLRGGQLEGQWPVATHSRKLLKGVGHSKQHTFREGLGYEGQGIANSMSAS